MEQLHFYVAVLFLFLRKDFFDMSYEIVYARNFVKTPKGRIVPLVLSGSNNCTEFINGREVRERIWGLVPYLKTSSLLSRNEFLASVKEKYPPNVEDDYELFRWHSKWVNKSQMFNWVSHGVKNAALLEDYRTASGYPVNLKCGFYRWKESKCEILCTKIVKTSAELDNLIDEIEEGKFGNWNLFLDIRGVREPLYFQKEISGSIFCLLKRGQYLYSYNNTEMYFCPDKSKAIVFDSLEDAENKLGKERFFRRKFVNAK